MFVSTWDDQVLVEKLQITIVWRFSHIECVFVCVCSLSLHCVQLFMTVDCSPPGSSVHEILQARILEWVSIPPSRGSSSPGIKLAFPMSPAMAGLPCPCPISHRYLGFQMQFSKGKHVEDWKKDTNL